LWLREIPQQAAIVVLMPRLICDYFLAIPFQCLVNSKSYHQQFYFLKVQNLNKTKIQKKKESPTERKNTQNKNLCQIFKYKIQQNNGKNKEKI
jgi:hypothetical protein